MRFAKRDSLFEAIQFTGDNADEVLRFIRKDDATRLLAGMWYIRWGNTQYYTMPPGQFRNTFVHVTDIN